MRNIFTLANCLTLSRFVTAPIFFVILLHLEGAQTAALSWVALVLVIVTLLTDMFDGMAARNNASVSDFGKIMDPVADSTFFMTAILALVSAERFQAPAWPFLIVLYREVTMHVLRRYAALRGVVLAAKVSGKAKMVCQSVALILLMLIVALEDSGVLALGEEKIRAGVYGVLIFVAAVNIFSLPEYLKDIPRFTGIKNVRENENPEV